LLSTSAVVGRPAIKPFSFIQAMNAFHSAGFIVPRLESSGSVAATSALVSFGSRFGLASSGAARQGGEEEADRLRVFFEPVTAGGEDELVVGRHAEFVDRGNDWVLAAQPQVDPLDVAEPAQHRLGAAADERRQQPVADVDRLHVGGGQLGAGEDRLQVGVLVGDAGGRDRLATQVSHPLHA